MNLQNSKKKMQNEAILSSLWTSCQNAIFIFFCILLHMTCKGKVTHGKCTEYLKICKVKKCKMQHRSHQDLPAICHILLGKSQKLSRSLGNFLMMKSCSLWTLVHVLTDLDIFPPKKNSSMSKAVFCSLFLGIQLEDSWALWLCFPQFHCCKGRRHATWFLRFLSLDNPKSRKSHFTLPFCFCNFSGNISQKDGPLGEWEGNGNEFRLHYLAERFAPCLFLKFKLWSVKMTSRSQTEMQNCQTIALN